MLARECDRCGKLYSLYLGQAEFGEGREANGLMLIDRNEHEKYWARDILDLCPDCMKALEAFLESGRVRHG